jgi:dimethylaniline monooxygenase (N-oxide forming)
LSANDDVLNGRFFVELSSFAYPDWLFKTVTIGALAIFCAMIFGNALRPKYRRLYGKAALLHSFRNAILPAIWVQLYMWLALIILWTPVWWLAVLLSGLTGLWTATGWFLAAFVAFYGIWIFRGVSGYSINRSFDGTAIRDAAPAAIKKRVAVIGAGMAGLVAAKELKEEGHDVVVFERTTGPGGVWASSKQRGGMAWGSTMTSTGALNSTLSDTVTKVYHPDHEKWPRHFDRDEFLGVLEDYRDQHKVFADTLRCETEVLEMELLPDQRWRLSVRDNSDNTMSEEKFDAVTICTGLNKQAFIPEISGQDDFSGSQAHIEDYRPAEADQYSGKRVLVIGLGETSSDVVKDLVDHGAKHIYVSQRGATFVIPRDVANLPADHVETRLAHDGPMFHRFATIFLGIAPATLFPLMSSYRIRPTIFRHFWRITVLNHPKKWELWRLGSLNWTKSDHIYGAMTSGHATVLRDIDRLKEKSVVFADGHEVEIDAIIYASGYRPGTSLLPEIKGSAGKTPVPATARDLYKLTIPPHHPNVAVIGYARGQIGAITVSSEIQARWWALLVSGKRTLPEPAEMAEFAARMRLNGRRFHQSNRTTGTFAYSIARQEIGCEPDMFKLFFSDLRLWHAVLLGPICSAHFRLRGHGERPDSAREQVLVPNGIQSDSYIDSVDLYANTLPLAVFLVPAYGFYSALLPGFIFQNATRSYI